jgi:hypothetical protein
MRQATLFRILALAAASIVVAQSALGQQSGKLVIQGGVPEENHQEGAQPLTNDSIIKLTKAGLGEDTVVTMVETQPGKYSLGADDIIALKQETWSN